MFIEGPPFDPLSLRSNLTFRVNDLFYLPFRVQELGIDRVGVFGDLLDSTRVRA
jgi:hypothetical protein